MEKAPVLDLDKVCRFQSPQLESDQIWGARCSSLLLWIEGEEGEGNGGLSHGPEGCGGAGQVFSLQRCLFPQQGSVTQKAKLRYLQACSPQNVPMLF